MGVGSFTLTGSCRSTVCGQKRTLTLADANTHLTVSEEPEMYGMTWTELNPDPLLMSVTVGQVG